MGSRISPVSLLRIPTIPRNKINKDGIVNNLEACKAIRDYCEIKKIKKLPVPDPHGNPVNIFYLNILEMLQGRVLLLKQVRKKGITFKLCLPDYILRK